MPQQAVGAYFYRKVARKIPHIQCRTELERNLFLYLFLKS